ncbi:MAG TPA: bifunctional YncE family protein/alkaline phosphatase family protein, partial [Vicinamibacterales bacterium]
MRTRGLLAAFAVIVCAALTPLVADEGAKPAVWPGYQGKGVTLLPNGWRIAPAGRHVGVSGLPMNVVASPDGRLLAISSSGWTKPSINIFDTHTLQVVTHADVDHTWLGLIWHPDGKRIFASGASENVIYEFTYQNHKLTASGSIPISPAEVHAAGRDVIENAGYVAGMALSPDGNRLYAAQIYGEKVRAIDIAQKQVVATAELGAEPYTCVLSPDGQTLYVSVWGASKIVMLDAATLALKGEITVGEHPNAMALTRDGSRLFVACANTNAVWVVDTANRTAAEQISVALGAQAPAGSTPNGLALSADNRTLLVANADNNTVAVADVSRPGSSSVLGWIPVGWYPTNVLFDRDGLRLFVLDGKGMTGAANPRGPQPGGFRIEGQYSGAMFQGGISTIPMPNAAALARMTSDVRELTPYSDATRLAPADAPVASPIPRRVGDSSPIKHVFYVIRENRTYDQVLGDLPHGNGDPSLTLFGEDVTPNAHALVQAFTTFDNFYVNAEVSYDGHAYSTGAIANDFVEKMWPMNYGRKEGLYLSEGGYKMRNPYGNIAAPAQGYLWDAAKRANVSYRSYGEFVASAGPGEGLAATVPGLDGHFHPTYPPFDLKIPDMNRIEIWAEEFSRMDKDGTVPQLSIVRIGGDHTNGTMPGVRTPRAYVAENDQALGRFVEVISHSSVWSSSAIFVLEDDAQNGPDHVDAHRSVLLAISPYSRHGVVDSTLYTTCGVLRTMELILGLPPMTQYDAAATPMYHAFATAPTLTAFTHLPARVSLTERNDWSTPGAAASARMDFSAPDLAPD